MADAIPMDADGGGRASTPPPPQPAAAAAAPTPLVAPTPAHLPGRPPRLIISTMTLENFKSYAGVQSIGPFHKV